MEWEITNQEPQQSRLRVRNVVSDESTESSADESNYSESGGVGSGNSRSSRQRRYSSESGGNSTHRVNHTDQSYTLSGIKPSDHQESTHSMVPQVMTYDLDQLSSDPENYFSVTSEKEETEERMGVPPPLPQRVRRVRARSSSEDNIPLAELARRYRLRDEQSVGFS